MMRWPNEFQCLGCGYEHTCEIATKKLPFPELIGQPHFKMPLLNVEKISPYRIT